MLTGDYRHTFARVNHQCVNPRIRRDAPSSRWPPRVLTLPAKPRKIKAAEELLHCVLYAGDISFRSASPFSGFRYLIPAPAKRKENLVLWQIQFRPSSVRVKPSPRRP